MRVRSSIFTLYSSVTGYTTFRNSESVVTTLTTLAPIFSRNNRPTRQAVRTIVDKFETKFILLDVPVPKRRRIARSEEIIAALSAWTQNEPK